MLIGLYQPLFNCSEFGSILNRFCIVGLTGCAGVNEAHQSRPMRPDSSHVSKKQISADTMCNISHHRCEFVH